MPYGYPGAPGLGMLATPLLRQGAASTGGGGGPQATGGGAGPNPTGGPPNPMAIEPIVGVPLVMAPRPLQPYILVVSPGEIVTTSGLNAYRQPFGGQNQVLTQFPAGPPVPGQPGGVIVDAYTGTVVAEIPAGALAGRLAPLPILAPSVTLAELPAGFTLRPNGVIITPSGAVAYPGYYPPSTITTSPSAQAHVQFPEGGIPQAEFNQLMNYLSSPHTAPATVSPYIGPAPGTGARGAPGTAVMSPRATLAVNPLANMSVQQSTVQLGVNPGFGYMRPPSLGPGLGAFGMPNTFYPNSADDPWPGYSANAGNNSLFVDIQIFASMIPGQFGMQARPTDNIPNPNWVPASGPLPRPGPPVQRPAPVIPASSTAANASLDLSQVGTLAGAAFGGPSAFTPALIYASSDDSILYSPTASDVGTYGVGGGGGGAGTPVAGQG